MRAERLALSREEAPIKCLIGFHVVGTSILSTNGYEQMRHCKKSYWLLCRGLRWQVRNCHPWTSKALMVVMCPGGIWSNL